MGEAETPEEDRNNGPHCLPKHSLGAVIKCAIASAREKPTRRSGIDPFPRLSDTRNRAVTEPPIQAIGVRSGEDVKTDRRTLTDLFTQA